jgi:hypothetical protein
VSHSGSEGIGSWIVPANQARADLVAFARYAACANHQQLYPESWQDESNMFFRVDFERRQETDALPREISRVDANWPNRSRKERQRLVEPKNAMGADLQPLIIPLVVNKRRNLTADVEIVSPLDGQLDFPLERIN